MASADLYADGHLLKFGVTLQFQESSELWANIFEVKAILLERYFGVSPGNILIRDSEFTILVSAYSRGLIRIAFDDHIFSGVASGHAAFQNNVCSLFGGGDIEDKSVFARDFEDLGVGMFAYLAAGFL